MQLEADMRENPVLRADVFVQRWQGLERQRRLLMRDREDTRAGRVADTMVGMAKGLERDPQVESILRSRKVQLGLGDVAVPSVARALADMIGRGRSRGIDIGM
ncbi:MAG: TraA [Sphingomonas sp.]